MIETICEQILDWKAVEKGAKDKIAELEAQLLSNVLTKPEGTEKFNVGQLRVTVQTKLNRDLNYEAYQAIESGLPEGVRCVTMKPTLDLKKMRALEMVDPGLVASFVTVKPAKPSVKIEVMG